MATRTENRSTNRSTASRSRQADNQKRNSDGEFAKKTQRPRSSTSRSTSSDRSAFSWGEGAGPIIAAALGGAAIGLAANFGRKALMQGMEATIGDWDAILAAEHDLTLAVFDKMLATDNTQTFKRKMLLMKLTHALDKHAHQEEMVVYPALREANIEVEADQLEQEHGQVKTYLYELNQMGADSPNWLDTVREFRALVSRHAHMEEEEVFPSFKKDLNEAQNAKITSLVNRDGFWMA
jgi:hemerythrin superfamily protein